MRSQALFSFSVLALFISFSSVAETQYYFDPADFGDEKIDDSILTGKSAIQPGEAILLLSNNGYDVGELQITLVKEKNHDLYPCLNKNMIADLKLRIKNASEYTKINGSVCLDLDREGISFSLNDRDMTLKLNTPHSKYISDNEISLIQSPPDSGVKFSPYINYEMSYVKNGPIDTNSAVFSSGMTVLDEWSVHVNGYVNEKVAEVSSGFISKEYYEDNFSVVVGRVGSLSPIHDKIFINGVSVYGGDSLFSSSINNKNGVSSGVFGYSELGGTVEIRYMGRLIQTRSVEPGFFTINDLSGFNGELDVTVLGRDGKIQNYKSHNQTSYNLIYDGGYRYYFDVGSIYDDVIFQSSGKIGVLNSTLYGGIQSIGHEINSATIGIGKEIPFMGLIFLDKTTDFSGGGHWGTRYSKTLSSNLYYSFYYNELDNFTSIAEMQNKARGMPYHRVQRGAQIGYRTTDTSQLTVFYSETNDQKNKYARVGARTQIIFSNRYNLTVAGGVDKANTYNQNWLSLNLTIPFSLLSSRLTFGQSNTYGSNSSNVAINGGLELEDIGVDYGASLNKGDNFEVLSANASINSGFGLSSIYVSRIDNSGLTQDNVGLFHRGAVTFFDGNVIYSPTVNLPAAVVFVDDGEGSVITRDKYNKVSSNGFAVISQLTGYNKNEIEVDVQTAKNDIKLSRTKKYVTPKNKAVSFVRFDSISSGGTLVKLNRNDIPLGASVFNFKKQNVGIVGDDGVLYIQGTKNNTNDFKIVWGDKSCTISYKEIYDGSVIDCH